MMLAAAAIPLMTLRRSMLGKRVPFLARANGLKREAPGPVIHQFENPQFDVEGRDGPHMSLKCVPTENTKGGNGRMSKNTRIERSICGIDCINNDRTIIICSSNLEEQRFSLD
jgi:hypothetical protein